MPYTKSKAGIGLGTSLSIGNGASPEVFTLVGEIKSISQSGRQVATEDVTNMQSSAKEFIPTLVESGTYDITGNRVGTDAGQLAMEAAFSGLQNHDFQIVLPLSASQTTKGDMFSFAALVQELNYAIGVDKAVTFTAKLKVTGLVSLTPGS